MNDIIISTSQATDIDTTPVVIAALRNAAANDIHRICFTKGTYHFRPDRAAEEYLFISNNDESLKRIAFPMKNLVDFEIDCGGSEFIFHGFVIPFLLQSCRNVTIKNFTMDWDRTYHSEAKILQFQRDSETGRDVVDLQISENFPYDIEHERLLFIFGGERLECLGHVLEFDTDLRETAFYVPDNGAYGQYRAERLSDGVVRIRGRFHHPLTAGNTLVMPGGKRYCPAIAVMDCENVAVSDATIHHCPGMGVIAQRTRNIDIARLKVTPNLTQGRMISATADATHFVNCAGQITIDDCVFENQMDDPVNIHGIYARVVRIESPDTLEVELVHPQQRGIDITQAGDTVEFVSNRNLLTYHEARVASFERLNKQYYRVTIDGGLPAELREGDGIASLGWIPDVTITNTTAQGNRARGFLVSTAGKVSIENNRFHSPGAAILIAGDCNFWFESGKVRDVTIRNNHFDNCMFGVWGSAVIDIVPEIPPPYREGTVYHRNIRILENRFDAFDPRFVKARCVDGLVFADNQVILSQKYTALDSNAISMDLEACQNVSISGEHSL